VTAGGNAGSAITVLEEDSSGATVTSQTDVITLIATGPNGYQQTYMATAVAGVATFNLSGAALNSSGVYTYTASAGSPTNAVATENVSAASASAVSLSGGSTSVTAGGNAGVISATIEDVHGNTVTSYSGAVTYTLKNAAGGIIASGTSTASSGIANVNLSGTALTLANTDTLTVTATSAGSTDETIAVSPGTASKTSTLTGINTGSTYTPGSLLGPLTTTVVDAYGNTVTSYSGTITYTLTLPDGTTTTGTATVVNGVVTVLSPAVTLNQVGGYSLTISGTGIAATTTTFSTAQLAITASISAPVAGVSYGTSLAGAITATATSNGTAVAGTWTYTATSLTTGATIAVTSATVVPAGSYTITGTFTPTDSTKYKSVTTTGSLRIAALAPAATIMASVNPVALKNATVLSASVSSSVGVPTGTVVFYDSTLAAPIGSAALSNGIATLSTASLAAGSHSIAAQYQGDSNYSAISSAAYALTVVDFTLAVSGSNSQTVLPGGIATYGLTVTPVGASTFPAAISLSVSGLPDDVVPTLSSASIAAGSGTTSVTFTIGTPSAVAMLQHYGPGASMAFAVLLLPFARLRSRVARQPRLLMVWMLAALTALGAAGLSGCGSSVGLFGQKQQTYTAVVTATSGSLTHTTNVTLTVQ
jgi:large repetitive protein